MTGQTPRLILGGSRPQDRPLGVCCPPQTRLKYIAITSFGPWSKHPESRSEIDRDRFVAFCGHRPGNWFPGFVR